MSTNRCKVATSSAHNNGASVPGNTRNRVCPNEVGPGFDSPTESAVSCKNLWKGKMESIDKIYRLWIYQYSEDVCGVKLVFWCW